MHKGLELIGGQKYPFRIVFHASRYEFNLVNLIEAFRAEFGAEDEPPVSFVVASIGFPAANDEGSNMSTIAQAQLNVSGDAGNYMLVGDALGRAMVAGRRVEEMPSNEG